MAKSVGARVNEDLYDWLEDKADREATTKARIVETLLIEEYKQDDQLREEEDESDEQGDEKVALAEVPQLRDLDERPILDTQDREIARQVRAQLQKWLAEEDDARLNDVRFAADVPEHVLRDARRIFLEEMREKASESA